MKSTNVKSLIAKVMTVGLLAGAVVLAAPAKAEAQGVAFGLQVGYPHYDYSRRDAFEFQRREAIRRQEEIRRAEWLRAHRFHDRFGWR
jgi:hypothetical protein